MEPQNISFARKHRYLISIIFGFIISIVCIGIALLIFPQLNSIGGGILVIPLVWIFSFYASSKILYKYLKPVGFTEEQEKVFKLHERKDPLLVLIPLIMLLLAYLVYWK